MFDEFNKDILPVLAILQGWAAELPSNIDQSIEECYVFGSLVNMEGGAFHPQRSVIDLIIVTTESNPQQLVQLLIKLVPKVDELEGLLKKRLDRQNNAPITDITLVTSFEQEEGIHKNRDSRIFFALQAFLPLIQPADQLQDMGDALADDLIVDFPAFSAWTVIANAQSQRYKFFRRGRDGKLVDYDGVHVLPKKLLRKAYAVSLLERENPRPDFSKEDDLFAGLSFLMKELEQEAAEGVQEAETLLRLLQSNRPGGRGELKPVEINLLLYAWELIRHRAQRSLMQHRAKKSQNKNAYAAQWVLEELTRYQAQSLQCIDTAIKLYSGTDLVGSQPTIPITINSRHPYNRDLHEIESLDQDQLDKLSKEWPDDIQKHLQARFGKEGSNRSECKVGFERIDFSKRGLGEQPSLSIRPLTYWVTRQFNKELSILQNSSHRELRREYAERLFVSAEDFYCECPSQLFLEVAIITKNNRVPVLLKSAVQSVMAKEGKAQTIRTCGPEHGFVWSRHVEEASGKAHLNIEKALQNSLENELGIVASEILSWEVSSFAIQHLHLNSALLGVVKIDLSSIALEQRLKKTAKYLAGVEKFLNKHQLFDQIQEDFGHRKCMGQV